MKSDKYKVGDRVRIRSDLKEGHYGSNSFVEEMRPCLGEIAIITKEDCGNGWEIDIDKTKCNWTEEMIEGLVIDIKYTEKDGVIILT